VLRALLALLVVAAVVPSAATTAGPGFVYDRELSWWAVNSLELASVQSGSLRKRIPYRTYVRCYVDRESFERPLLVRGATGPETRRTIAYYDRRGYVHLRSGTCERARRFAAGTITQETAGAFTTLLHEALHRQGFRDENATECWAIASVKFGGWLARWNRIEGHDETAWLASERTGDRALVLAYRSSLASAAAEYLVSADCLDRAERESWSDYLRRRG
jgi:hypothetical protein